MKLTDLDPTLILWMGPGRFIHVDRLEGSNGVMFLCPKCFQANGGPVGTHTVICWFRDRDVPDYEPPVPGRWEATGNDVSDLSLHASIHLKGDDGCGRHGFIKNGEAT